MPTPISAVGLPPPPDELDALLRGPVPTQRTFPFDEQPWLRAMRGNTPLTQAIRHLPRRMNRDIAYLRFRMLWPESVCAAFIVVMAWAYGGQPGYGPHRVNRILHPPDPSAGPFAAARAPAGTERFVDSGIEDALRASVEIAVAEGPVPGFHFLSSKGTGHIGGLGPAFFTKWLNFATEAAGAPDVTPVFDSRAERWLAGCADDIDAAIRAERAPQEVGWTPTTPESDRLRLSVRTAADFGDYCALLSEWGAPHQLPPAAVAERIFRLIESSSEE